MKVIQFTIPVANDSSIVVQEDILPFFYPHLHRHHEVQITRISKGRGTLVAGNYMQVFNPGDIYILGTNQPHLFKSDPVYFAKRQKKQVHALSIFFNPAGLFSSILAMPEAKLIHKFIAATTNGLQVPAAAVPGILAEMLAVQQSGSGFRLAAFIRLLQTLAGIKKYHTLSPLSSVNHFSDNEGLRMNEIYQYTMTNYSSNISLQQIAAVAHLTPQAFCRYFKKHTRKTYTAFLNEIRINEACKRLISGNGSSITGIAYETGFNNAVNFNRVFKKVHGKSPGQYLKAYMQKQE